MNKCTSLLEIFLYEKIFWLYFSWNASFDEPCTSLILMNGGSPKTITSYDKGTSRIEHVEEVYNFDVTDFIVENWWSNCSVNKKNISKRLFSLRIGLVLQESILILMASVIKKKHMERERFLIIFGNYLHLQLSPWKKMIVTLDTQ